MSLVLLSVPSVFLAGCFVGPSEEQIQEMVDAAVEERLAAYVTRADADLLYAPTGAYLDQAAADSLYQPVGEYVTPTLLDSYLTKEEADKEYARIGECVTPAELDGMDYLTQTEASDLYQVRGEYVEVADLSDPGSSAVDALDDRYQGLGNYVTFEALAGLGYLQADDLTGYATEDWVDTSLSVLSGSTVQVLTAPWTRIVTSEGELRAALSELDYYRIPDGITATITIANDLTLASNLRVRHPDGSQIQILGQDPTVTLQCTAEVSGHACIEVRDGDSLGLLGNLILNGEGVSTEGIGVGAFSGASLILGPALAIVGFDNAVRAADGAQVGAAEDAALTIEAPRTSGVDALFGATIQLPDAVTVGFNAEQWDVEGGFPVGYRALYGSTLAGEGAQAVLAVVGFRSEAGSSMVVQDSDAEQCYTAYFAGRDSYVDASGSTVASLTSSPEIYAFWATDGSTIRAESTSVSGVAYCYTASGAASIIALGSACTGYADVLGGADVTYGSLVLVSAIPDFATSGNSVWGVDDGTGSYLGI